MILSFRSNSSSFIGNKDALLALSTKCNQQPQQSSFNLRTVNSIVSMALIFILPREEGSGVADFCRLLDNGLFTENGKKALLNNKKFLLVLICINNTCTLYFGNRYTMERYNTGLSELTFIRIQQKFKEGKIFYIVQSTPSILNLL